AVDCDGHGSLPSRDVWTADCLWVEAVDLEHIGDVDLLIIEGCGTAGPLRRGRRVDAANRRACSSMR
ncbi:MAG: hypothetical protein QGM49_06045, partial [Actinomycetota bacterium]|nr:hypothetical protein [Actinomycetota bacterium]